MPRGRHCCWRCRSMCAARITTTPHPDRNRNKRKKYFPNLLQVLYLDLEADEGLATLGRLAAHARGTLAGAGIAVDASHGFTPHVTVAKLSQLPGKLRRIKRIPEVQRTSEAEGFRGRAVQAGRSLAPHMAPAAVTKFSQLPGKLHRIMRIPRCGREDSIFIDPQMLSGDAQQGSLHAAGGR